MHKKKSQFILLKIPPHVVRLSGKIHALSIEVLSNRAIFLHVMVLFIRPGMTSLLTISGIFGKGIQLCIYFCNVITRISAQIDNCDSISLRSLLLSEFINLLVEFMYQIHVCARLSGRETQVALLPFLSFSLFSHSTICIVLFYGRLLNLFDCVDVLRPLDTF